LRVLAAVELFTGATAVVGGTLLAIGPDGPSSLEGVMALVGAVVVGLAVLPDRSGTTAR
jgi:hypothetical protein